MTDQERIAKLEADVEELKGHVHAIVQSRDLCRASYDKLMDLCREVMAKMTPPLTELANVIHNAGRCV